VAPEDRERVAAVVQTLLAEHRERLKVTPGKMVYEFEPKMDWDKGRAVLYLMGVLGLDSDAVVPLYLGDDITDEDAFRALRGRGGGHGHGALPGHLRPWRLRPGDHDLRWTPGAQRGPGQPAQLAGAEAANRGRGHDPARQRRGARLPAHL